MNGIDFLPRRVKVQRQRIERIKRQVAYLMLFALVLGAWGWANETRIAEANERLADSQREQTHLAATLSAVPGLTAELAAGQIQSRISRELGSRLPINVVLAEMARLLPPSASLTGLKYSTVNIAAEASGRKARTRANGREKGAGPKGDAESDETTIAGRRVRLEITGVTPRDVDVANIVAELSACPLLSDVTMGYSKTVDLDRKRRKGRSFQVNCLMAQ